MTAKKKTPRLLSNITVPTDKAWQALKDKIGLKKPAAHALRLTLQHVQADIETHNAKLKSRPDRALILRRFRDLDKILRRLNSFLTNNAGLIRETFPHRSLEAIGTILSEPALKDALGEDRIYDRSTESRSVAGIPEYKRKVLGLKYGPALMQHFIRAVHSPIQNFLEDERRTNRGGRPGSATRDYLIMALADNAEEILGKRMTSHATKEFRTLAIDVISACGLSEKGVEVAIQRTLLRWHRAQLKNSDAGAESVK